MVTASYTYDANGNTISGNGTTIAYTSFNKPSMIARGSNTLQFDHDPELQRFRQTGPSGVTLYLAGSGVMAEPVEGSGGSWQWNHYLVASGGMVGLHITRSDTTVATRYFHKDHLGSVAVLTNEAGAVVERLSYDAWGKRRFPNANQSRSEAAYSYSGAPEAPPGVDVGANIEEAGRYWPGIFWFYDQVKNGEPWDYKQVDPYEEFGNFNYGAAGAAFGFSEATLLRMAGWAQVRARTSSPSWGRAPNQLQAFFGVGGVSPFGDDPSDQKWISRGVYYYNMRNK